MNPQGADFPFRFLLSGHDFFIILLLVCCRTDACPRPFHPTFTGGMNYENFCRAVAL